MSLNLTRLDDVRRIWCSFAKCVNENENKENNKDSIDKEKIFAGRTAGNFFEFHLLKKKLESITNVAKMSSKVH